MRKLLNIWTKELGNMKNEKHARKTKTMIINEWVTYPKKKILFVACHYLKAHEVSFIDSEKNYTSPYQLTNN